MPQSLTLDSSPATHETVSLSIPAKPEYVLLARLALSALCRQGAFDTEVVNDLKLAITEAASASMRSGANPDRRVEFSFRIGGDGLAIEVLDPGPRADSSVDPTQEELAQAIMHAVVDRCEIRDSELGRTIRLVKYLPPRSDPDPEAT